MAVGVQQDGGPLVRGLTATAEEYDPLDDLTGHVHVLLHHLRHRVLSQANMTAVQKGVLFTVCSTIVVLLTDATDDRTTAFSARCKKILSLYFPLAMAAVTDTSLPDEDASLASYFQNKYDYGDNSVFEAYPQGS